MITLLSTMSSDRKTKYNFHVGITGNKVYNFQWPLDLTKWKTIHPTIPSHTLQALIILLSQMQNNCLSIKLPGFQGRNTVVQGSFAPEICCPTLTKGSKWQITQIWDIDVFRLDLACSTSSLSFQQKHSSCWKMFKSRHHDIALMSMKVTDTFCLFMRNITFMTCSLLSKYSSMKKSPKSRARINRRPWPPVPLLLAVMPLKILGYLRPKKRVPFSHLAVMPLWYYVCPFAWP